MLLHNDGEDKAPIKLSGSLPFHEENSNKKSDLSQESPQTLVPESCLLPTDTHGCGSFPPGPISNPMSHEKSGHPDGATSTDVERNVTADRRSRSAHYYAEKVRLAKVQAAHDASLSSEPCVSSNDRDLECTAGEATVDDDGHSYPEGGMKAWGVVIGAWSGMIASFGILNTVGTFQAYLSQHQLAYHSPGSIGWIFSIFAFLTFFCGVQIGPIFDAKGSRDLVAAGTVCLFAGLMGTADSTSMVTQSSSAPVKASWGSSLLIPLSQNYGISSSHSPSSQV